MSVKQYDCLTCPYPRYKDGHVIFCDVCIRRILDERNEKKKKENCEFAERMQQNGSSYEPKPAEGQPRKAAKNKNYER